MSIHEFLEYAEIIKKYRPMLEGLDYEIIVGENKLCLESDIVNARRYIFGNVNWIGFPDRLEEALSNDIVSDKELISNRIKRYQAMQKELEILIITIDNAN